MLYPPMSVTDHHPLEHGAPTLDTLFSVPFLLHRPMKPLNVHGNSINATFARNGMPSSSARRWQSWKKSTLFYSRRQTREDLRARSLVEMEALKDKPSAEKRAIESCIWGLFPTELKVRPTHLRKKAGNMNGDLLVVLYTNLVRRLTQFVGPRLTILRLVVHKGHMLVHKVKNEGPPVATTRRPPADHDPPAQICGYVPTPRICLT